MNFLLCLQSWDASLASVAQELTDTCVFAHGMYEDLTGTTYARVGQNLYMTTGWDVTRPVFSWWSEREDYDYDTDTCDPGKVCGHYTQVGSNLLSQHIMQISQ